MAGTHGQRSNLRAIMCSAIRCTWLPSRQVQQYVSIHHVSACSVDGCGVCRLCRASFEILVSWLIAPRSTSWLTAPQSHNNAWGGHSIGVLRDIHGHKCNPTQGDKSMLLQCICYQQLRNVDAAVRSRPAAVAYACSTCSSSIQGGERGGWCTSCCPSSGRATTTSSCYHKGTCTIWTSCRASLMSSCADLSQGCNLLHM